ncbi:hypothetical protein CP97_09270 [Aurantiacibacter atlanticus]|uniref:Glyoxalase/fosfomycin resistance/dioxygenase domain-containing protein n=1 Tax=Aurantiacibacter atlanticus TaxID=1648404 RepID=A0A0H4VBY4_9SPHN|nr:VOC family protein [Aurantiacibacter atlanticus]AKQ42167.1 hypothetical protein CP97_09270 [Aurantiacibacter atlanticus]MDF1833574.1 VOC family protein [Alteraurantiacibacter sp. bin_em_oilr2.035]
MAVLDYLELPVKSTQEQQRFYGTAFGWCFTSYGPDYAAHEGGPCQMGLNGVDNPQRSTGILPIIRVSDVEAARDSVLAAGGKVTVDIFDFPGGRRFHFTDPQGFELGCYEPTAQGD